MDSSDENSENNSNKSQNFKNTNFKWKEIEIPSDLLAEGLFSLEVLEDDPNHDDSNLKPLKKKKKVTNHAKTENSSQENQLTIDSDDVYKKTKDWSNLSGQNYNLPFDLLVNLHKHNFNSPTSIQRLTFKPSIIDKTHVLISSETGSGKTLCFVLPIVLSLLKEKSEDKVEGLVLLPTRELAVQVKKIFFLIVENTNVRVLSIIGGISIQKQERLLKKNPSIIVATPGRLDDFITGGKLRGLFQLRFLVLDEVDKFFEDNSFKEVQSIVKYVRRTKIQYFLSSATILNMKDNLNNLFKLLNMNNPIICISSKDNQLVVPYEDFKSNKLLYKKPFTDTHATLPENLGFRVIECEEKFKEVKLVAYLVENLCNFDNKKCIIFVNTVTYVYRLEALLSLILWKDIHESRIQNKYCATSNVNTKIDYISGIHSRLKQKQRLNHLEKFSTNEKSILICTDVASRGLDVPNVDIVIHFHPPKDKSLFLHRSGRTARLNANGVSVCICSPDNLNLWHKLFGEINKNFGSIEKIEDIPREKFLKYKELLQIAENIEKNELRLSKEKSVKSWVKNAAKRADIMLSDEEDEIEEENERKRSYKVMKSEKIKLLEFRSALGIDN